MKAKNTKPAGYRTLLTIANAKTVKGEKLGYKTGIMYLSPANESGVMDTCTSASDECIKACLKNSGRMPMNVAVRIDKTLLLHRDRELFLECLRYDIRKLVAQAKREGMIPAVRINGTSDLPWIARLMAEEFPDVQFYDYTKHVRPYWRTALNYHLTFSYSGHNLDAALDALRNGVNVAVVFDTRKGEELPATWKGFPVVDGDEHDLRFLDHKGAVVGLRAKGKARKITSAFIVRTQDLIQISLAA